MEGCLGALGYLQKAGSPATRASGELCIMSRTVAKRLVQVERTFELLGCCRAPLKYPESIKYPANGKPCSARDIGSMVADVHRTLLHGGIFGYPGDKRSKYPDDKRSKACKLRLLYEVFPMAYLIEQAGVVATTGTQRILDIVPEQPHQRVPVFLGSKDDVEDLLKFHQEAK
ncbi:hypothetical protein JCM8547_006273 [Rhodosporidiobolus lusitaniae]